MSLHSRPSLGVLGRVSLNAAEEQSSRVSLNAADSIADLPAEDFRMSRKSAGKNRGSNPLLGSLLDEEGEEGGGGEEEDGLPFGMPPSMSSSSSTSVRSSGDGGGDGGRSTVGGDGGSTGGGGGGRGSNLDPMANKTGTLSEQSWATQFVYGLLCMQCLCESGCTQAKV